MSGTLADLLVKAANEPDLKPFAFQIGEKVGVRISTLQDGQTPRAWIGVKCEVTHRWASLLQKSHWYTLCRPDGHHDDFREEELKPGRYVRKRA